MTKQDPAPSRPPTNHTITMYCLHAGTQAAVCSLRHFIHWRHPAVVLEEVGPWEARPAMYQARCWQGAQAGQGAGQMCG